MKKFIIFVCVAILGLIAGLFFSKQQPPSSAPRSEAVSTRRPTPFVTGVVQSQPTYYSARQYSFPTSLTQYQTASSPQTEKVVALLTSIFGFSSSPNKIEGSKGTHLVWNESGKSLVIGGNPLEVSYSSESGGKKNLSADTSVYKTTAQNLLTKLSSLFGEIQTSLASETYILPSNGDPVVVDDPTKASVYLANYNLLVGGFPLITASATIEGAAIGVDADNNVLSFRTYVFPQLNKTPTPSSILSYDEARELLVSNEGVLLNFSYVGDKNKASNIVQSDTPPQISSITNVLLGYYFSPEIKTLIPVYLFLGEGTDKQGSVLSTTTIVSATK